MTHGSPRMDDGSSRQALGTTVLGSGAPAGGAGTADGADGGQGMCDLLSRGAAGNHTPYLLTHWERAFVRLSGLTA